MLLSCNNNFLLVYVYQLFTVKNPGKFFKFSSFSFIFNFYNKNVFVVTFFMDEEERKKYPSLPPDYVSLAQLQERWLQKQQDTRLKEEREHELLQETPNRENENQTRREVNNHGLAKMEGHSIRKVTRGRVEKDGREMGVVDEKQKRKEEPRIGGFGNGVENKKKGKKKSRKKKKYAAGDEKGNGAAWNGFGGDMEKNGFKLVGAVPRAEGKVGISGDLNRESSDGEGIGSTFQGNEEIVSVNMVEVLPKDGEGEENPGILNARNVRRMGSRSAGYESKECRVKMHEPIDEKVELALKKKIEDEVLEVDRKGSYNKWRARKTNHGDRETDYKLKERRAKICGLKYGVVELNSERKVENEILEVGNRRDGVRGRAKNGFDKHGRRNEIKEHIVEGEGLNDNRVTLEKKLQENAKNGKNVGVGNEFRRNGNWRGSVGRKIGNFTFNNWNFNMRSRLPMNVGDNKRCASFRRFEDGWNVKQRDGGMVWVKKEKKPRDIAAEVGSSDQE